MSTHHARARWVSGAVG